MVTMFTSMLVLFCTIVKVLSDPASSLYKCKSGDDVCATKAVKAWYPLVLEANAEIGTEDLDPMFQPKIEGILPVLNYTLFNTTVIGFKSCAVQNAQYNEGQKLEVDFLCPGFNIKGQYDVKGRIISLPIEGNGDYTLITKKYRIKTIMELKTIIGKDSKTYKNVKNYKLETEPLESIHYDLKNLFNGQKDLADAVIKFMNNNWREVIYIVQEPVFKANINKIIRNVNKFIKTLSIVE